MDVRDEKSLLLAAEAVVDAAIRCYEFENTGRISEAARRALIDAVYRNPLLTRELFRSTPDKTRLNWMNNFSNQPYLNN